MKRNTDKHIEVNSAETPRHPEGRILASRDPVGQVDDRLLSKRTFEIAEIEGRKLEPTREDYAQARAELLGEDGPDGELIDAIDDPDARDPSVIVELGTDDEPFEEDEEELSRLEVEQGVEEAAHEQMTEARKSHYDPREPKE